MRFRQASVWLAAVGAHRRPFSWWPGRLRLTALCVYACVRTMSVSSVLIWAAAAPSLAQGPGPLRPRPQPPAQASREGLPPTPRIGREPAPDEREPFRYVPPSDAVLAKAVAANIDFHDNLPNFVCRERMTRSSSRDLGKKWKRDDVVEAEILTIGDKVEYRDTKVDGKPTGAADISQIGGVWSVGEYGAVVINIFNPRSRTQFAKQGPGQVGDREVLIYNYKIEEEHSHWKISANGRSVMPAHHGKVWIDAETGRALRVETEATYLPHDFPLASGLAVLEYGEVEIDGRSYLLPSRAENTFCERGSVVCSRLDIHFLDYRRFTSESTLFTTDSDIEFGDEVPESEAKRGK